MAAGRLVGRNWNTRRRRPHGGLIVTIRGSEVRYGHEEEGGVCSGLVFRSPKTLNCIMLVTGLLGMEDGCILNS